MCQLLNHYCMYIYIGKVSSGFAVLDSSKVTSGFAALDSSKVSCGFETNTEPGVLDLE